MENYIITTLKEVTSVFTDGDWIETKDQSSTGIRLIQTGNVGSGIFKGRAEKARYISLDTFQRLRCEEIFEGDCLVSRLPDPVGRACIIPASTDRLITAVDCTIIRFNPKKIIPDYFKYFSQSAGYLAEVDAACTGATRKRISRSKLGEITIPLPPLPEQKRMVAILDEAFNGIDTAIANTEKNLVNAHEFFERRLRQVFNYGKQWKKVSLGEIAEIKGGKRAPKGYRLLREPTPFPYLRVTDFENTGTIDMSNLRYVSKDIQNQIKAYIIRSEDLYISIAGTIGRTGIVPKELDGAQLTENACRLVFKPGISNRFVYYFTKTDSFCEQATVNTRTAAQPKLALSRLATITLRIPKFIEQERWADEFDALREYVMRLEAIYHQKLTSLEHLKQSLLQKAFAGELNAHRATPARKAAE